MCSDGHYRPNKSPEINLIFLNYFPKQEKSHPTFPNSNLRLPIYLASNLHHWEQIWLDFATNTNVFYNVDKIILFLFHNKTTLFSIFSQNNWIVLLSYIDLLIKLSQCLFFTKTIFDATTIKNALHFKILHWIFMLEKDWLSQVES